MKKNKAAGSLLACVLAISLGMFLLWPGPAFSESGINIISSVKIHSSTAPRPSPYLPWEAVYRFRLRNYNDDCDEKVKIYLPLHPSDPHFPGLENDPGIPLGYKRGITELYGFSRSSGGPWGLPSISYMHEDTVSESIYFKVETGEDANGCDFQGFKLTAIVCDTGPHCKVPDCCDDYDDDRPCEGPTPYTIHVEERATAITNPPGEGKIKVWVEHAVTHDPLHAAVIIMKDWSTGGCVPSVPDNAELWTILTTTVLSPPVEWGTYETPGIPYGFYIVTVCANGECETRIDVLVNTPAVVNEYFSFPD